MEERVDRRRGLLTVLLIILVAAGAAVWLLRRPESRPLEIVAPPQPTKARERVLKVYVSGEVLNPGVYAVQEGDRVEDALKAAGGTTEEADRARINLAARLQDQQQVNVPRIALPKQAGTQPPGVGQVGAPFPPVGPVKLNLNTASAAELDALPGIGPVTTQKILSYRERVGLFSSVEDLRDAKLVDRAQFEKIKELVVAP